MLLTISITISGDNQRHKNQQPFFRLLFLPLDGAAVIREFPSRNFGEFNRVSSKLIRGDYKVILEYCKYDLMNQISNILHFMGLFDVQLSVAMLYTPLKHKHTVLSPIQRYDLFDNQQKISALSNSAGSRPYSRLFP